MNKLLVNVDEVSMTQQQANDIKNMIPGETMMFEKKGLDKITLRSHMDLILTSNNDHCVYILTLEIEDISFLMWMTLMQMIRVIMFLFENIVKIQKQHIMCTSISCRLIYRNSIHNKYQKLKKSRCIVKVQYQLQCDLCNYLLREHWIVLIIIGSNLFYLIICFLSFVNTAIHNVKLRNGLLNHFKCQSQNNLVLKQIIL